MLLAASFHRSAPQRGSSSDDSLGQACDCDGEKSVHALLSGSHGCLLRGVLSPQRAAAAARAVRRQLQESPALEVRGGSGADVASFDGGGGEKRPAQALITDIARDDAGTHVAFDSSAAADAAVSAAAATVTWPAKLRELQTQYSYTEQLHDFQDGGPSDYSWPILSAGAFPSGIPPHVHGSSHLLLLQGRKTWAIWRPERGLPEAARMVLPSPLLRTNATEVFASLDKLRGDARPLFCKQRPGDVMLLPAGTHHATLNMAPKSPKSSIPVIGIGGQQSWSLDRRLQMADRLLDSGTATVAAHAIAGVALASRMTAQQAPSMVDLEALQVATWHLQKVVAAEPSDARAVLALADVLEARGEKQRALGAIMEAVESLVSVVGVSDPGSASEPGSATMADEVPRDKHATHVSIAAGLRRCVLALNSLSSSSCSRSATF
jgi:hypothetical protein